MSHITLNIHDDEDLKRKLNNLLELSSRSPDVRVAVYDSLKQLIRELIMLREVIDKNDSHMQITHDTEQVALTYAPNTRETDVQEDYPDLLPDLMPDNTRWVQLKNLNTSLRYRRLFLRTKLS